MAEITGNEAVKAREQYENLLQELIAEETMQISQRNNDNSEVTCKLFLEKGLSVFDHVIWRDADMISEMQSLLIRSHLALNPWKYEEYSYDNDPVFDPEPVHRPRELFPGLDRLALERLAAEEFLLKAAVSPQKANSVVSQQSGHKKEATKAIAKKKRVGQLDNIEMKDMYRTGLSDREVVNHWKGLNPNHKKLDKNKDEIDYLKVFRDAVFKAKDSTANSDGDALKLPFRISSTKRGRWYKYALHKEGRSGPGGGSKYGIIKEEKNS